MARRISIGGNRETIGEALRDLLAQYEKGGDVHLAVEPNGRGPYLDLEFVSEGDDPEFNTLLVDYYES